MPDDKIFCRKCGRRIYKEREKRRFKCDYCYKGEQNGMSKFLPGVENLKLIKKIGFCSRCGRPLRKKLDMKTKRCEFCRIRNQERMTKYARVKK